MNKIIRDVRVDELPKEWQDGLPEHGHVDIEIRSSVETVRPRVRLADLAGSVPNVHGSIEEAVAHIRQLRGSDD